MSLENKYFSLQKALEYAKMSWPQWPENRVSEPFYAFLANKIDYVATEIESFNPLCLEFGFGAGRILFEISKSFPSAKIIGIEISPHMIDISRSLLSGTPINFIQASIESAPIKDSVADLTVCINVLDRVRNTTLATKKLIKIAKKSGFILVANAFDYESPFTPVAERLAPQKMIDLFEEGGCKIIEDNNFELAKILPSGEIKRYNERVLILRKKN